MKWVDPRSVRARGTMGRGKGCRVRIVWVGSVVQDFGASTLGRSSSLTRFN